MSKPPSNPLMYENKQISYFQYLYIQVKPYVESYGINLSFKGYQNTLNEYQNINFKDTNSIWNLANDLNSWSEYMSDVANVVQKLLLDSETEKIGIISKVSIESDSKKVASGDRIANKDERVIAVRKKRNALKSFYSQLESKIEFLERAYHHCKSTYDWQCRSNLQNN